MLSKSFRPGTDLISKKKKKITRQPLVLNIITKAILNITDEYLPESCEWPNGTRSDVVLVPKSADADPTIIIEFQRTVDKKFMEKAIAYYLQASKRFGTIPTILIVCIESVQDSVKERLRTCDDLPCYTACSDFWADQCYVMDKNSIQDYISQDPFAAFGLFMTNQATSIDLALRNTDPTMNMLYRISLDVYTKILDQDIKCVNELKQLNDVYYEQPENILSLLKDDNTSRSSIIEYVSQSAEYNREQKRKSDELITEDDLQECQDTDRFKCQRADNDEQVTTSDYKERMKFIEKFKEDRAEEGKTMSWKLCLLEGREKLK
ncbi:uncharacterized protein B0P05DRAFT_562817 [Gilbertella persicaria]|uniref:uncharacterized protein n=1 Tax=Gilbertella persicaria TaxID=101096 RepID=UPI00221FB15E|nr:uncharacterized protein B0P05DRAFT_562817 [Gilbertella persicaria]KAI8051065.1 hypothetical protein B0P05DRAFT_562817 [Gilbertella persicaria]